MSSRTIPDLVSLAGLLMALTLYTMLLAMVVRERGRTSLWQLLRAGSGDALPLWTALAGLAWNLGAFAMLLSAGDAAGQAHPLLLSGAFAALGFLPALFVDASLRPWGGLGRRAASLIRGAAYALSLMAAILHLVRFARAEDPPSTLALQIVGIGYCILVPALLWIAPPQARVRRGLVASAALLAFGFCALHLRSQLHGNDTWSTALFGHHASLPLVLAILYEDYRFAFADIFLKRALALMALVGLVFGAYIGISQSVRSMSGFEHADPSAVSLLLVVWVGTAVAYPILRRWANRFVDAVVLSRPDYAAFRAEMAAALASLESPEEVLDVACARLTPALSARFVEWSDDERNPGSVSRAVTVPTTDSPSFTLRVGELTGGRRLLSDEATLLDSVALLVARRIDSLRLTHERYQRDTREQEIAKLATEAELRALRAQLNPHFLFNALNTIGYLMHATPERAMATLLDLTHLLRAVLKRAGGEYVTLGQEIELVQSYLAIERARFEDRLRTGIDVPPALWNWPVPTLIVQPLVENAIKHGIARRAKGGEVTIIAREDIGRDAVLTICVSDSGAGSSAADLALGRRRGLGLANIEKRLTAYYGSAATLEIVSTPGAGTRASLRIPRPTLSDAHAARRADDPAETSSQVTSRS